LAKPVKVQWLTKLGGRFVELYGLTEGFGTLVRPALERDPYGCGVGPAMAGTDLRIIGDDDAVLGTGQAGEIVGRSAVLLSEYFRKPEQDLACQWIDEEGHEFFRSGDIGYLDEEGYLHVVDRKKDMIISGGFNVFPADIEAVFLSHAAVADVAVIGALDEKWGETPVALVIRRPGHDDDESSLQDWINPRLSKTQRVSQVRLVLDFPRNALGKVLKRELRAQWNSAQSHAAGDHSVEVR
jgi:long-chain acyl-CoA synthetase